MSGEQEQYPQNPPQGYGQPQYPPYPPQAYQQPYYYSPVRQPPRPLTPSDERMWGMLSYLLALFGGFVAPLIIWLVYKDRSAFVRDVARESLNFHITAIIAYLAGFFAFFFVAFGLTIVSPTAGAIVFMVLWVLIFAWVALIIIVGVIGAVRANSGVYWRIPGILRFVK